jgi:hypothetical protein
MKMSFWRLIVALFLVSGIAHAQKPSQSCPWLNAATAGGVLGGEVRLLVTHTPTDQADQPNNAPGDATCEFRLTNAAGSVKIAVHTMQSHAKEFPAYLASCGPSPRKLVGVGNEAVACTLPNGSAGATEQVVGRIRQRVFILSWSIPANAATAADAAGAKDVVRDKLQNTAEQVAGSLF